MRRFSLYRRGQVWYCKLYNPAVKRYMSGRSTGESQRNAAMLVVAEWLSGGLPEPLRKGVRPLSDVFEVHTILNAIRSTPLTPSDAERIVAALRARELVETAVVKAGLGSELFIAFLENFWDYEDSPYVRDKLAHDQRIGRRHCYEMALLVRHYWKPYFSKRLVMEIRKTDLQAFSLFLKEEKHLKGKTINNCLAVGTVALRWAHQNEIIPSNPAEGLMKFSCKAARRGVLTEVEVKRLFATPWADERAYLGNALAMSTGLRAGEVLGLQVRDIEDNRLRVRHSWSNIDKLKGTKTGDERTVPLLPELRARLLELARRNPHGMGPCSFVFWSVTNSDRPMDAHGLADPLKDALLRLSLTEEERKDPDRVKRAVEYWRSRRVSYHSWRHLWAARMADRLEARKVMSATGHKNGAVFEVYADHVAEKTLMEVQEVSEDTFGRLLPFRTVSDVMEGLSGEGKMIQQKEDEVPSIGDNQKIDKK